MAEQKSEDTTPVAGRRVARPAVGPAGAVRSGVRPVLRPVGGHRPVAGPFAAPIGPERKALGITTDTAAAAPPAPVVDSAMATPGPAPQAERSLSDEVSLGAPPSEAVPLMRSHVATPDPEPDWQAAPRHEATFESPAPALEPSPESVAALPPWLEDDYAPAPAMPAADPVSQQDQPVSAIDSSPNDAGGYASEIVEASFDWADAPMPADDRGGAHLDASQALGANEIDASASPSTPSTRSEAAPQSWPDPLLAEYAPYVTSPEAGFTNSDDPPHGAGDHAVVADAPGDSASDGFVFTPEAEVAAAESEPVLAEHGESVTALSPAADEPTAREAHVAWRDHASTTLDRLAARVRAGEIDVSSVAPGATEAAVLASLLAALLGGSSSR